MRAPAAAALLAGMLAAACGGRGDDGGDDGLSDAGRDASPVVGGYLILTDAVDGDPFWPAVERLRDYRGATVIPFDPAEPEAVLPALQAAPPDYVAFVLEPLDLDVNVARRVLMMSTEVDPDPFSDFGYGFITGATGDAALAFVERIIQAEAEGIADAPLTVSGWAASSVNAVYTTVAGSFEQYLEPVAYSQIYLKEGDPGVIDYFQGNTSYLAGNKLLDVGYNGDPHMLWLFEGGNEVPDIWAYDPALVESPPVTRLGLTSDHVRALDLYPAVAFNGACHSGTPKRALVEGDIAATFGDTGGVVRFYEMSDDFSFALAMLEAGVTGYFAPIAANHALDNDEDVYAAFRWNEPLGDVHKRSVDGVVMGFLGNRPRLRIFADGESVWQDETLTSGTYDPADFSPEHGMMLSGKANRVYFGDPLFHPFANHRAAELELATVTVTAVDEEAVDVDIVFDKPDVYFPVWDKFHADEPTTRLYTTVELPAPFASGVTVTPVAGTYVRLITALETHRGRVVLHVEADTDDDFLGPAHLEMTLRVTRLPG